MNKEQGITKEEVKFEVSIIKYRSILLLPCSLFRVLDLVLNLDLVLVLNLDLNLLES